LRLLDGWGGQSVSRRWIYFDTVFWCAAKAAGKERSIYAEAGVHVHYPFMQPRMLPFAVASIENWKPTCCL
jgi:hypothetical protein